MADNDARAQSASAGTLLPVATDDIGGVQYQRIKLSTGGEGVAGGDMTTVNPLNVRESPITTPALTVVPASQAAAGVVILAANANRLKFTIYNDSALILYLKFGSLTPAPSVTSYSVRVQTMSMYQETSPCYAGIITGVWATGTLVTTVGAKVTEFTA